MIFPNTVFFEGVVENRYDTLKLGRVQVRISGLHPTDQTLVSTADLPWACVVQNIQSAAYAGIGASPTGIVEGSKVFGIFLDGRDAQLPLVLGTIAGGLGHFMYGGTATGNTANFQTPPPGANTPSPSVLPTGSPNVLGGVPAGIIPKAAYIANKLAARYGLTPAQAAGAVGALQFESGPNLSPNIFNGGTHGTPVLNTPLAYGWGQWLHDRKNNFINFGNSNNLDLQSDECNYQFLCHELDTTYQKVITNLKQTTNTTDAVSAWVQYYEGISPTGSYANQTHLSQRTANANAILPAMINSNVPIRGVGTDAVTSANSAATVDATTQAPSDIPQPLNSDSSPITYEGEYPYNKVFHSESGHLIEIDDTPGAERLLTYHKSGTYQEILASGKRTDTIVDDFYEIDQGDRWTQIDGDWNISVRGDINITALGNITIQSSGDINLLAGGSIKQKSNALFLESAADTNIKSGGLLNAQSAGDQNFLAGGNINEDATSLNVMDAAAIPAVATGLTAVSAAVISPTLALPEPVQQPLPAALANTPDATSQYNDSTGDVPVATNAPATPGNTAANSIYSNLISNLQTALTEGNALAWNRTYAKTGTSNPNIMGAFAAVGYSPPNDKTAWCAAFAGNMLKKSGAAYVKSLSSQAYKGYGTARDINDPTTWRKYDVMVFTDSNGVQGHVTFFYGFIDTNTFVCLGGNQGSKVKLSTYSRNNRGQPGALVYVGSNWPIIPTNLDIPYPITSGSFAPTKESTQ